MNLLERYRKKSSINYELRKFYYPVKYREYYSENLPILFDLSCKLSVQIKYCGLKISNIPTQVPIVFNITVASQELKKSYCIRQHSLLTEDNPRVRYNNYSLFNFNNLQLESPWLIATLNMDNSLELEEEEGDCNIQII